MDKNIEEALRAITNAEKSFTERDFSGAKSHALKAQMLCPNLEGISQMVATFAVYAASLVKINGEFDFYGILGLDPSVERSKVKKQYKKMAVLLHPDKNKTVGADGAFRLVSEAWTVLSDNAKRSSYDHRRNFASMHSVAVGSYDSYSKSAARLDTFWTVCTSCHVQYEYLRKYVNKRLSCKNCRGVFVAVETGAAPVTYCPWSCMPDNGYNGHGITYGPTTAMYCTGNGVSGHHSTHGSEYTTQVSYQRSSFPDSSSGYVNFNYQASAKSKEAKPNGKRVIEKTAANVVSNGLGSNERTTPRRGRPPKKRILEFGNVPATANEEIPAKAAVEVHGNGNLKLNPVNAQTTEISNRRCLAVPAFDARQLLIDKARTEIRKKLEEIKLASARAAVEAEKRKKLLAEIFNSPEAPKRAYLSSINRQLDLRRTASMAITVPDSDFHDFDKDRSEECFKPKQIWALYDEEDGMPRLYCLIRQVISVKPFKIQISYLSSKSDSEFGTVNWLNCGFTKSCGHFRAFNSDIIEQVNIFSHLLSREKAGRGGCVRIYPKSGHIWAVYRNWSPDWNRKTPDEVRHQYEMVEVLDDYSEELGVCVTPLVKVDGFKTVYRRNINKDAIRWIPKREMLRFSHQVPSCLLKGGTQDLPEGCWDLDPAATPEELLQTETPITSDQVENFSDAQGFQHHSETGGLGKEQNLTAVNEKLHGDQSNVLAEEEDAPQDSSSKTVIELPQAEIGGWFYKDPSQERNNDAFPG